MRTLAISQTRANQLGNATFARGLQVDVSPKNLSTMKGPDMRFKKQNIPDLPDHPAAIDMVAKAKRLAAEAAVAAEDGCKEKWLEAPDSVQHEAHHLRLARARDTPYWP